MPLITYSQNSFSDPKSYKSLYPNTQPLVGRLSCRNMTHKRPKRRHFLKKSIKHKIYARTKCTSTWDKAQNHKSVKCHIVIFGPFWGLFSWPEIQGTKYYSDVLAIITAGTNNRPSAPFGFRCQFLRWMYNYLFSVQMSQGHIAQEAKNWLDVVCGPKCHQDVEDGLSRHRFSSTYQGA